MFLTFPLLLPMSPVDWVRTQPPNKSCWMCAIKYEFSLCHRISMVLGESGTKIVRLAEHYI